MVIVRREENDRRKRSVRGVRRAERAASLLTLFPPLMAKSLRSGSRHPRR
jgi:hypothetical protein